MNILDAFNSLIPRQELAYAEIIGMKGADKVVAKTPTGAVVVLVGSGAVGGACLYDRRTSEIVRETKKVVFKEYGV